MTTSPFDAQSADPLSQETYDAALAAHQVKIGPALRRIDAAIERAAVGDADPRELAALETMRVLLLSGLFDDEFYLGKYADLREAQVDPLDHYVRHGDEEGRLPNLAFFPEYYRRHHMPGAPSGSNVLKHYIERGEASGAKPNFLFDGQTYLADNPGFSDFVDRPLFHYLKIGRPAGNKIRAAPVAATLEALDCIDEVARLGSDDDSLPVKAKQALTEGLGTAAGFAVYGQLIDRPDHAEIHLKRLDSLRDVAKRRSGAFRETAPAGEPFVVPPPRVIGEGNQRSLEAYTRSMFVACLIDARVRARSNVIEVDDVALLDYEGDELARFDDRPEFDPAVFQAIEDAAWIITPKGDSAALEIEEAFTLLGVRPDAFGHWMIEYLPKYIAASLSGVLPRVPLLIDAGMPNSHREALELMRAEGVDIVELAPFATARVRRLWCAPSQAFFPIHEVINERFKWEDFVMPPARFAPIIREMARRCDLATAEATGVDRVFLAREASLHHKLVNREAIEAAAAARGFLVINPERIDFRAQAGLLRHARHVVGPCGSAMFLTFFARPGTKLCILSSAEDVVSTQADMSGMFGAIGVDVTVFTGRCAPLNLNQPWNSDFEIDEEGFSQFLDRWLQPDDGCRAVADAVPSNCGPC